MKKLSTASRIIIAIGSLVMIVAIFVPVWSIYLIAPQYPEGLSMQIWLNKITGQVEIINGLNHYIGMKHINANMFPEFTYLVYVLGFFVLFGLTIAIIGSRRLLFAYLGLSLIAGLAALTDFYMWGYDYGHDLDPTAAIQVPGLSYQPPLIGHKKLLNFDSYSYPDSGGWVVVVVTMVFFILWFIDWRRQNIKIMVKSKLFSKALVSSLAALLIVGCNPQQEKISIGKDNCEECKMTIMDPKYGCEIVTKKGKVFKFDDLGCMAGFMKRRGVEMSDIHQTLSVNFNNSSEFINVTQAEFVVSSELKTPMGGNAAAFKEASEAKKKSEELKGSKITNWATLYNILVK